MKKTAFLLLLLTLLTGCAGRYSAGNSFVGSPPEGVAQQIATDAVAYMTSLYPPGYTTLDLVAAKDRNDFSQTFENSLRAKGFVVVSGGQKGAVTVVYVLDQLRDNTSWYLQLKIADSTKGRITVTRSYTATGQPEAGFSTEAEHRED